MAKQSLQKAIYRNAEGHPDVQLFISEKNDDGTLELVDEKGVLKIGKCKIGPKPGDCYIAEAPQEAPQPNA